MIQTTSLYGGNTFLDFDDANHQYSIGGRKIEGSISDTLKVINKPAIGPWMVKKAVDHLAAHIQPGEPFDEIQINELLKDAKAAAYRHTSSAADLGTMGHTWIEKYLLGEEPPLPFHTGLRNVALTFLQFTEANDVQPLFAERRVYSQKFDMAGTFDRLCLFNGQLAILDWKTGTDIYDEYFLQMGGYSLCYHEEAEIDKTLPGPVKLHVVVNCSKTGTLKVGVSDQVSENEQGFCAALDLKRQLQRLHKGWTKL